MQLSIFVIEKPSFSPNVISFRKNSKFFINNNLVKRMDFFLKNKKHKQYTKEEPLNYLLQL
jgi:hypothetical protein